MFNAFGKRHFHIVRLTRRVATQCGHRATAAASVAMFSVHIDVDESGNIERLGACQRFTKTAGRSFGHQVSLRTEMLVEASMGETGSRHEIRHTDTVKTALTEQL
ncbi:hypothetical protein D3C85_1581620 [compost metagenome]